MKLSSTPHGGWLSMAITLIIYCNLKEIFSLEKGGVDGDFVLSLMSLGQNPYLENTLMNVVTLILKYSMMHYTIRTWTS
jgi:hypothetical protein